MAIRRAVEHSREAAAKVRTSYKIEDEMSSTLGDVVCLVRQGDIKLKEEKIQASWQVSRETYMEIHLKITEEVSHDFLEIAGRLFVVGRAFLVKRDGIKVTSKVPQDIL